MYYINKCGNLNPVPRKDCIKLAEESKASEDESDEEDKKPDEEGDGTDKKGDGADKEGGGTDKKGEELKPLGGDSIKGESLSIIAPALLIAAGPLPPLERPEEKHKVTDPSAKYQVSYTALKELLAQRDDLTAKMQGTDKLKVVCKYEKCKTHKNPSLPKEIILSVSQLKIS